MLKPWILSLLAMRVLCKGCASVTCHVGGEGYRFPVRAVQHFTKGANDHPSRWHSFVQHFSRKPVALLNEVTAVLSTL